MKAHIEFKRIIQYCKLMNYDVNDILKMSDNELRVWYQRVTKITKNETEFRILTGMSLGGFKSEERIKIFNN